MDQNEPRAITPTAVFASRLRHLRTQRRWSADRLAEEMNRAGASWTRMVVTKVENGRRQDVSIAEWLALAYVLDVPPLELIAPLGQDVKIEVLPGLEVGPYELWGWLTGRGRLSVRITPDTPAGMQFWNITAEPIKLYQQFAETSATLHRADLEARVAEKIGDPQRSQSARTAYLDALQAWADVVNRMRDAGMQLPAYVPQWAKEATELGFLTEPPDVAES